MLRFPQRAKIGATFAFMVASLIGLSPANALDVCSLISRSEIGAAIGQPISSENPAGPALDEATGSRTWTCTYGLGSGSLVVSVAEFPSNGAAKKYITLENLRKELKEAGFQVTEEKGIGDRTFELIDEDILSLSVLKGTRYYAVTTDRSTHPPDRLRVSLRKIATMLLPKL